MVPSRRALGVLAALFVVGCHSDKTGPEVLTPSSIAASGSTSFTGTVGSALATPPAVLVTAKDGKPVPGATVTFAVTAGGGSVVGASAPTNTQGIATVGAWVLGKAPATPNTLTATVSGLSPVTFTATGAVGSASKLAAISGDGQAGDVGSPMSNPFVVRVTDAFDNPIVNAPVTFALTSGSGTLVPSSTTTDAQGRASSTITLSAAGPTSITASSSAVTGVSVPFNVSTGPTIQGKVTVASGLVRPFSTGRGVASASSN
ncbi:MAG TPA: Ig-like domain-containing protein, partial [Gemmatimonadaceae bacterium]